MAVLCSVRIVRCCRVRLAIAGTIDRLEQCGFAVAIAVDQVGRVRCKTGMIRVDCVHGVEVISRIVDVDGDTRQVGKSLGKSLFIGIGQSQKCRGCEC